MENIENFSEQPYFNVPYYDTIFKKRWKQAEIFSRKGISKIYNAKMTTKEKIFKDAKTKKQTIYIDLGVNKFNMINTIYGVLNLQAYKQCILKQVPGLHYLLFKNRIELQKKHTEKLVKINQLLIAENLNDGSFIRIGTPYMIFTTMEQLTKGYEQFMRDYYINKRYDAKVHTIQVEIFYTYVEANKN